MADHAEEHEPRTRSGSAGRWVFWGFALVGAYFVLTEHRAHALQYLPYLLLAACPLMHMFHHGGHRHHGNRDGGAERRDDRSESAGHRH